MSPAEAWILCFPYLLIGLMFMCLAALIEPKE